jgi:hypothetical protein
MKSRIVALGLFGLTFCMVSSPAKGGRYDLSLYRYFERCVGDADPAGCANRYFKDLMTEIGLISAPVFLAPAETLGLNGFEFSIEGTLAPLKKSKDYWSWNDGNSTVTVTEGAPQSMLFVPRLHVRKGLPFSFEIGTQLSYIPESEMFVAGAEVKWALNEGFYYIPDLAVRVAVNHMIGPKDFVLSTGGWDISLSKAFGVGGMMSLTPYAGYNMLFINASSHVVMVSPSDDGQVFSSLNWQDNMIHRFFAGLRLKTHIFQITAEGIFSAKSVNLFSFKLGFDY